MAKKRFKVDIMSQSSIEQLIKELRSYQNSLEQKTRLFCERLAEIGVETAKATVYGLDAVFTGELFRSIHSEQRSSGTTVVFAVVADSEHAIYVEMGTGLVGAESPYPGKLPAVYAQGKSFVELLEPFGKYEAGTYGWFYERDGHIFFTEGMPSRPFMYFASLEMQENIVKIAKEVFA